MSNPRWMMLSRKGEVHLSDDYVGCSLKNAILAWEQHWNLKDGDTIEFQTEFAGQTYELVRVENGYWVYKHRIQRFKELHQATDAEFHPIRREWMLEKGDGFPHLYNLKYGAHLALDIEYCTKVEWEAVKHIILGLKNGHRKNIGSSNVSALIECAFTGSFMIETAVGADAHLWADYEWMKAILAGEYKKPELPEVVSKGEFHHPCAHKVHDEIMYWQNWRDRLMTEAIDSLSEPHKMMLEMLEKEEELELKSLLSQVTLEKLEISKPQENPVFDANTPDKIRLAKLMLASHLFNENPWNIFNMDPSESIKFAVKTLALQTIAGECKPLITAYKAQMKIWDSYISSSERDRQLLAEDRGAYAYETFSGREEDLREEFGDLRIQLPKGYEPEK